MRCIFVALSFCVSFLQYDFAYAELPSCFKEEHWINAWENFRITNMCPRQIKVYYETTTNKGVEKHQTSLGCGQEFFNQYFKETRIRVTAVESWGEGCGTPGKQGNLKSGTQTARPPQGSQTDSAKRDFSPGFDCLKAATDVETTICANERLSRADNNLNKAYKQLMERVTSPEEIARIRSAQKDFLTKRNKCATVTCIDDLYTQRTEEIFDETRAANDVFTSQPVDDPLDQQLAKPIIVDRRSEGMPNGCAQPDQWNWCMSTEKCMDEGNKERYGAQVKAVCLRYCVQACDW